MIGCGKMGIQHLKAIRAVGDASVVGIADPQADRDVVAEFLAPGGAVYDDASAMLAAQRPDVVHIVTPPGSHEALTRLAIEAGCHVYVEKPFTPTRAEAESLLALASSRGVTICPGHQVLFERPAEIVRERIGSLGRLVHVESYFSFQMVRRTITRSDQAKDILPHAVYPLVEQMRLGSRRADGEVELLGLDVRSNGDVYGLLRLGEVTGVLMVTLNGRPIEHYQQLVGTLGSMRADYIAASVVHLSGTGAGPGVLVTPYRRALQTIGGATKGFAKLIFGRRTSYPGLTSLVRAFYENVRTGQPSPLTPQSIVDTVGICERVGQALDVVDRAAEQVAERALRAAVLPALDPSKGVVYVTGGTGLLGRPVAEELRHAGFAVRVATRRLPPVSARLPGVEYVTTDLARGIPDEHMQGVGLVVHCAAETAGGKDDHQRNSIAASRNVLDAAAKAGVRRVVHTSSIGILKPGHQVGGGPLNEGSPVDIGNLERGPYVWGKAESERLVQQHAAALGLDLKVVRPGPLVDYTAFHPPGRLGREVGPWFVAIGGRSTPLAVCDVSTAARVIRSYAENFAAAPPMLNLVEAPVPTRLQLLERYRADRPDLKPFWVPGLLLRALSGPLKIVQRLALGAAKPIDVYAAFSSEQYDTSLAQAVIARAGRSAKHS